MAFFLQFQIYSHPEGNFSFVWRAKGRLYTLTYFDQ